MRKIKIKILLLNILLAQNGHIPPCGGTHHVTDGSICRGYALGRTYGKTWNDNTCPLNDLLINKISNRYHEIIPFMPSEYPGWLSQVQPGDILLWQSGVLHAAYVTNVSYGGTSYYMSLDQVHNIGGEEQTNLSLGFVISDFGNPDGYARKITYSLIIKNEFDGGNIKINNIQKSSPHYRFLDKGYSFTSEIINNQVIDGINYAFDNWNDGNTNTFVTFSPEDDTTSIIYIANFTGTPTQVQNVHDTGANYQPIQLAWNTHPNSNVSYQLWRKVILRGSGQSTTSQIATLSNSSISYTDSDYDKLPIPTHLLRYDVRAYYSTDNTTASPSWYSVSGGHAPKIITETNMIIPEELSVGAYPNPFNPTTEIKFGIPTYSNVLIKVYNLNGQEVSELYNGIKEPGYHSVSWSPKNSTSRRLSSGVYIIQIIAQFNEQINIKSEKVLFLQ